MHQLLNKLKPVNMIKHKSLALVLISILVTSANGDYCNTNCHKEFQNSTNLEFQPCLDAQDECGMVTLSFAINIGIGLLTLIGIIAIGIRCCLLAKLIGGKGKDRQHEHYDEVEHKCLQNDASRTAS